MKYIALALVFFSSLDAARLYREEKQQLGYTMENSYFVSVQDLATLNAKEHHEAGMKAFEEKNWQEAAKHLRIVKLNFYHTPYAQEATYYLAVSYYNEDEIDLANEEFSDYLKSVITPQFFQEAIEYKFAIAERLKEGERRHMFGLQGMPKWFTGKTYAVEIYDEVIAAMPACESAVRAHYAKGILLKDLHHYRESIDAFQELIKRFPKHELAPEAYVQVADVYLQQSKQEFQNPDILTFAEINMRKFALDYPREPRIQEVQQKVASIHDQYADGLYETGRFYERREKPQASILYYQNAINRFPDSNVAKKCQERIAYLEGRAKKQNNDHRSAWMKNQRVHHLAKAQQSPLKLPKERGSFEENSRKPKQATLKWVADAG